MKVERCQANKILFLTAYSIWMIRAFIGTTFYYEHPLYILFEQYALETTVFLCILCAAIDFELRLRSVFGIGLTCLLFWLAYANGALGASVAVILIYAARNVPFRSIAKWTMFLLVVLLLFTMGSAHVGVIENKIFLQGDGRVRFGMGFLYCSYSSHYLLLFFMLYLVIRKTIRWYEIVFLLFANGVGFLLTDTRTDIISLVLMAAGTVVLYLLKEKKVFLAWIARLGFCVPFLFWGVSLCMGYFYDVNSPRWQKMGQLLNGRLRMSHEALEKYDLNLFGQKIKWIGGSAITKNPKQIYNYVDNNYISVTLQMGVLFAFVMCFAYGRAAYIAICNQQMALATGLFVFMVVGLVNPEMRNLLYNTFVIVLAMSSKQLQGIEIRQSRKKKELQC